MYTTFSETIINYSNNIKLEETFDRSVNCSSSKYICLFPHTWEDNFIWKLLPNINNSYSGGHLIIIYDIK